MIKIKYIGVMGTGFVHGVGTVKRGETYNVDEVLADKLLKTRSWEKEMIKKENKKTLYKS